MLSVIEAFETLWENREKWRWSSKVYVKNAALRLHRAHSHTFAVTNARTARVAPGK